MGLIITKPRGGATLQLIKEAATETPNGIITDFTTQTGNYKAGSLTVYMNGVRERYAVELGGNSFRITPAPRSSFKIDVEYSLES
jgi:hypothetical protein